MKKIISVIFILIVTAGGAFAEPRYHYEINEEKTPVDKLQPLSPAEQKPVPSKSSFTAQNYYHRPMSHNYVLLNEDQYTAAYPTSFEVNANQSDVEAVLGHTWEADERTFLTSIGISGLYSSEEDYKLFSGSFTLGNRALIEGLRLDMGFRGVWGEIEKGKREGDVGAVGFLGSLSYDFPEVEIFYGAMPFDSEISGSIHWSPGALCFDKLDNYIEMKATFGFYVLEQKKGFLFVGARSIMAEFEEESGYWKKTDNAGFLGCRFIF
ncbi:MAG: hypothetical protein GY795_14875 [Desulfobacterales bacterium]|nr:hypothetical protein [Desulfobacterales bacterium]